MATTGSSPMNTASKLHEGEIIQRAPIGQRHAPASPSSPACGSRPSATARSCGRRIPPLRLDTGPTRTWRARPCPMTLPPPRRPIRPVFIEWRLSYRYDRYVNFRCTRSPAYPMCVYRLTRGRRSTPPPGRAAPGRRTPLSRRHADAVAFAHTRRRRRLRRRAQTKARLIPANRKGAGRGSSFSAREPQLDVRHERLEIVEPPEPRMHSQNVHCRVVVHEHVSKPGKALQPRRRRGRDHATGDKPWRDLTILVRGLLKLRVENMVAGGDQRLRSQCNRAHLPSQHDFRRDARGVGNHERRWPTVSPMSRSFLRTTSGRTGTARVHPLTQVAMLDLSQVACVQIPRGARLESHALVIVSTDDQPSAANRLVRE